MLIGTFPPVVVPVGYLHCAGCANAFAACDLEPGRLNRGQSQTIRQRGSTEINGHMFTSYVSVPRYAVGYFCRACRLHLGYTPDPLKGRRAVDHPDRVFAHTVTITARTKDAARIAAKRLNIGWEA